MKHFAKQLLMVTAAAGVLGTTAVAWAHGNDRGSDGPRAERMQKKMEQHQAKLKEALKLSAAQEPAWKEFTAAMQPPQQRTARLDRAEWDKLTTPQRMDKMQAMRAEREAHMNQRMDAVKKFYGTLTPEQQKVFDEQHRRMGPHGGHHGERQGSHHGQHHG